MVKFLKINIPVWLVIFIVVIFTTGLLFLFIYFAEEIYDYEIFIPFIWENKVNYSFSRDYGFWPELSNPDFFKSVQDDFISQKIDFVEVDLSEMKLKIYKNGVLIKEVEILTKGKEGAWWETPSGLYKIESMAKNHFSGFGKVYQPYTMFFQGNFAIHGWPYYPDGTPVKSTFSGGCIRLSTEDAKEIFNLVKIGTPVLVFEKDFKNDDFKYKIKEPKINAQSYLAADLKNNFIFFEKSPKEILPVASISKLISALVVIEHINLEKEIAVNKESLIKTSKSRLEEGKNYSVFNLLYPLLLESSNEAAAVFENYLGKNYFISLMNKKAASMGMENSRFIDASGSGNENISTVEDLFNLAKHLYFNRSFILKITAGDLNKETAYGLPVFKDLGNFNLFFDDPAFIGGKIGKTEIAKETMIAVFEIKFGNETRPIAIIVLKSEDIAKDILNILNLIKEKYSLENYEEINNDRNNSEEKIIN